MKLKDKRDIKKILDNHRNFLLNITYRNNNDPSFDIGEYTDMILDNTYSVNEMAEALLTYVSDEDIKEMSKEVTA